MSARQLTLSLRIGRQRQVHEETLGPLVSRFGDGGFSTSPRDSEKGRVLLVASDLLWPDSASWRSGDAPTGGLKSARSRGTRPDGCLLPALVPRGLGALRDTAGRAPTHADSKRVLAEIGHY